MNKPASVLFVCLGNICRSPSAEVVFRTMSLQRGIAFSDIQSVGTGGWHVGEAPDRRAILVGARRGFDLSGKRGNRLTPAHFNSFDFMFAMDRQNLVAMNAMRPRSATASTALLLDALGRSGPSEVADPYYGDASDFEVMFDVLESACGQLLDRYQRRESPWC